MVSSHFSERTCTLFSLRVLDLCSCFTGSSYTTACVIHALPSLCAIATSSRRQCHDLHEERVPNHVGTMCISNNLSHLAAISAIHPASIIAQSHVQSALHTTIRIHVPCQPMDLHDTCMHVGMMKRSCNLNYLKISFVYKEVMKELSSFCTSSTHSKPS
jgi:hypothetical protein